MKNRLVNVMQLISSLEVGGAEKLLLDLLEASQNDDCVSFTVVIMNQAVNPDMQKRLERMGLNAYYLNRPEGHLHFQYLRELLQITHRHQIDIVHAHNSGSKLWAMLCKLIRPSLKLVFTIHDTVPAHYGFLQKLLHRYFIDQHIAISKSVEVLCKREGFYPRTQIYNGIDLLPFLNSDRLPLTERLARQSFDQLPLRIVQVGRMHYPKKGQDLLVQAINHCKKAGMNVTATLMGGVYSYSQKSYEELQQMVVNLGLVSEIEFLINRTDVPDVLKNADLFVLASRYEGLGLVVLEAMAAGVPVIASNIDGPAELITTGENGLLFESGNSKSLFDKIKTLYYNPEMADAMAQNSLLFVKEFDIHRMKSQYYDLYETLVPPESRVDYAKPMLQEVVNGTSV